MLLRIPIAANLGLLILEKHLYENSTNSEILTLLGVNRKRSFSTIFRFNPIIFHQVYLRKLLPYCAYCPHVPIVNTWQSFSESSSLGSVSLCEFREIEFSSDRKDVNH